MTESKRAVATAIDRIQWAWEENRRQYTWPREVWLPPQWYAEFHAANAADGFADSQWGVPVRPCAALDHPWFVGGQRQLPSWLPRSLLVPAPTPASNLFWGLFGSVRRLDQALAYPDPFLRDWEAGVSRSQADVLRMLARTWGRWGRDRARKLVVAYGLRRLTWVATIEELFAASEAVRHLLSYLVPWPELELVSNPVDRGTQLQDVLSPRGLSRREQISLSRAVRLEGVPLLEAWRKSLGHQALLRRSGLGMLIDHWQRVLKASSPLEEF